MASQKLRRCSVRRFPAASLVIPICPVARAQHDPSAVLRAERARRIGIRPRGKCTVQITGDDLKAGPTEARCADDQASALQQFLDPYGVFAGQADDLLQQLSELHLLHYYGRERDGLGGFRADLDAN